MVLGDGLGGRPQGLRDNQAAEDPTPGVVRAFADPDIGAMGSLTAVKLPSVR